LAKLSQVGWLMLHLDGRKYSPPALDFRQVDLQVGGEQTVWRRSFPMPALIY